MNSSRKCSRPLGLLIQQCILKITNYSPGPLQLPSNSATPACMRYTSTTTTSVADPTADPAVIPGIIPNHIPHSRPAPTVYRIASSVIISRSPMLTRDLGAFEASYHFYQRRLNDRLQLPFTRWFYFKKGTLADEEWKRKQAAAEKYNAYGPRQWADELLVGDNKHTSEDNGYQYLVDTTVTGEEETLSTAIARVEAAKEAEAKGEAFEHPTEIISKPFPRATKAGLENDTRSLDREMSRTLYLLVKTKNKRDHWRFPQSLLVENENLREGAERTLRDAAGVNMHTWFVGNVPIGHRVHDTNTENVGRKVFFMKARILAGQADLTDNSLGLSDFQWLTKQEIEKVVGKVYFRFVEHMLVAR